MVATSITHVEAEFYKRLPAVCANARSAAHLMLSSTADQAEIGLSEGAWSRQHSAA